MKVFYNENMAADSESFSPSAIKPKLVIEDWLDKKMPIELINFEPLQQEDFYLAHDKQTVDGILSCQRPNGFRNTSLKVAQTLAYTNGSMYAAAKEALNSKITVSPTSGFHHAEYYGPQGYCTFNGLMIAAIKLFNEKLVKRVGILDLDMHYGNGTVDIINYLNIRYVHHFTGGGHYHLSDQAPLFFQQLPTILNQFNNCDLIMYQAGADPHINDPMGGWLTTNQLMERDRQIFKWCKNHNKPIVWNFAGGYQKDENGNIPAVLEIHRNTLLASLEEYEI